MTRASRAARSLAVAAAAVGTSVAPWASEDPRPQPRLVLTVDPTEHVADLDRLLTEQRVAAALVAARCGFELAMPDGEAGHRLRIEILKWREEERPGGARRFDPSIGAYVPGTEFEIEVRYRLRVEHTAREIPLATKEQTIRNKASTSNNPLFDPRGNALDKTLDSIARRAKKFTCKTLSKKRRSKPNQAGARARED